MTLKKNQCVETISDKTNDIKYEGRDVITILREDIKRISIDVLRYMPDKQEDLEQEIYLLLLEFKDMERINFYRTMIYRRALDYRRKIKTQDKYYKSNYLAESEGN